MKIKSLILTLSLFVSVHSFHPKVRADLNSPFMLAMCGAATAACTIVVASYCMELLSSKSADVLTELNRAKNEAIKAPVKKESEKILSDWSNEFDDFANSYNLRDDRAVKFAVNKNPEKMRSFLNRESYLRTMSPGIRKWYESTKKIQMPETSRYRTGSPDYLLEDISQDQEEYSFHLDHKQWPLTMIPQTKQGDTFADSLSFGLVASPEGSLIFMTPQNEYTDHSAPGKFLVDVNELKNFIEQWKGQHPSVNVRVFERNAVYRSQILLGMGIERKINSLVLGIEAETIELQRAVSFELVAHIAEWIVQQHKSSHPGFAESLKKPEPPVQRHPFGTRPMY